MGGVNIQHNQETAILVTALIGSVAGALWIMRHDWKGYGLLFIASGAAGSSLCYILVVLGFYSFPFRLFPALLKFPLEAILTFFPVYNLVGVRYSPLKWSFKIPFYWALVNLGLLAETLAKNHTTLIRYDFAWDFWDSYTLWWLYFLLFEWIGGKLVPPAARRPIPEEFFRYGNWGWIIFHAIMIGTIFGIGWYVGDMRGGLR